MKSNLRKINLSLSTMSLIVFLSVSKQALVYHRFCENVSEYLKELVIHIFVSLTAWYGHTSLYTKLAIPCNKARYLFDIDRADCRTSLEWSQRLTTSELQCY